jgi:germination protein M
MKKMKLIVSIIILALFSIIILCSCSESVTLYFADMTETDSYLVGEVRIVKNTGSMYKTAVEELIKGPSVEGLYPTLPSDTVVNSVSVSDGLAAVDFNIRIIDNFDEIPHSSTTETLAIYSIVNTLTEFEEIEKVRITIEGRDSGEVEGYYVEDFWGHIGIYESFERNEDIIKDGQ